MPTKASDNRATGSGEANTPSVLPNILGLKDPDKMMSSIRDGVDASANMLTAIVCSIIGDTNIKPNTPLDSLKSKVKNAAIKGNANQEITLHLEADDLGADTISELKEFVNVLNSSFTIDQNTDEILQGLVGFSTAYSMVSAVLRQAAKDTVAIILISSFYDEYIKSVDTLKEFLFGTRKNGYQGIIKVLSRTKGIDDLNTKELVNIFKDIVKIFNYMTGIGGMAKTISKSAKYIPKTINVVNAVIDTINEIPIKDLNDSTLNIKLLADFLSDLKKVEINTIMCGLLAVIASKLSGSISKGLDAVVELIDVINNYDFKEITKSVDSIKPISEFMKSMAPIYITAAIIGPVAILAIPGFFAMKVSMKLIIQVIDAANSISTKIDKKTTADFKNVAILIGMASALLLIGVGIGLVVMSNIGAYFVFTATLSLFLFTTVGTLLLVSKMIKSDAKIFENAHKIAVLISICAATMLIGALFVQSSSFLDVLTFAGELAIFIAAVVGPFALYSRIFKNAIVGARQISLLIITCAATMLIGALFVQSSSIWDAIKFAGELFAFITIVMIPFRLYSRIFKNAIVGAGQIALLILTCTAVMMIGALFVTSGLVGEAIEFAVLLAGFIFAVMLPFVLEGKNIKQTTKAAKAIMLLILTTTAVLMLGALFMNSEYAKYALEFAALAVGFIGILTIMIYALSKNKHLVKGIFAMVAIVAIVALMGAALMLFSSAMQTLDSLNSPWESAALAAVIILGIGAMVIGLGELGDLKTIGMGSLYMTAIVGVTLLMGVALGEIAGALAIIDSLDSPRESCGVATKIILAIAGMIVAAGLLVMGPQVAVFAAGVGVMTSIAGVAGLIGAALIDLSTGLVGIQDAVKKFKNDPIDSTQLTNLLNTLIDVGKLSKEINEAVDEDILDAVASKTKIICKMVSKLSNTISDVASLTYTDERGEKHKLTNQQFTEAAENVKTIISTLGGAIIETYNLKPEMFETAEGSLFDKISGRTVFSKVVVSCTNMSSMISKIAEAVKDYAALQVPIYNSKGEQIGSRQLKNQDFKDAADNISTIITTIGGALIKLYDDHEDMFGAEVTSIKDVFTGSSKFQKVIASCLTMSEMIGNIAVAIKDYASLQIPTKYDKEGKPTSYREMKATDFSDAATNIANIVTTIGKAIGDLYSDPKCEGMFEESFFGGKSKFSKVVTSCTGMGELISTMANSIKDYANMRIATEWDENGNPTKYGSLDEAKIVDASKQIQKIVTSVGLALLYAYNTKVTYQNKNTTYGDLIFDPDADFLEDMQESIPIVGNIISSIIGSYNTISNGIGNTDIYDTIGKWAGLVSGIYSPLIAAGNTANVITMSKLHFDDVGEFITKINSVDTSKVDSISNLVSELRQLAESVGDVQAFLEILNDKFSITIDAFGNRLIEAKDAIEKSDKAQLKRQALLKKNTDDLKKVMETPLKVEVKKTDNTASTASSSSTGNSGSNNTPDTTNSKTGSTNNGSMNNSKLDDIITLVSSIKTSTESIDYKTKLPEE